MELLKHTDFHSAYKPDPALSDCRFKSGAYLVLCGLYLEKNYIRSQQFLQ